MWETPSKIISSVFAGLGQPEAELIQESEIARIVFRKLAFYYEGLRQSDQNLMAEKTSEFTLASGVNSEDVTSLTTSGAIIPLWCERQILDGTNTVWEFVPTVNMDTLPERRMDGILAVGFYGATANQITAEFSSYGDELSPYSTFRIWYAPANSFSANKDATVAIPDSLTSLIVVDAQLNCIPILKVNASKYVDKRPELSARVQAWDAMVPFLTQERMEWGALWEGFRKKSRGSHRAINHNDILDIDGWYR